MKRKPPRATVKVESVCVWVKVVSLIVGNKSNYNNES